MLTLRTSLLIRKVDACTIMRDPSGTSRGFAFMTFEDANAVNLVVSREHELDGKMVSEYPLTPTRTNVCRRLIRNAQFRAKSTSETRVTLSVACPP